MNFEKVSGGAMTINEIFPYSEGMKKGNSSTGDQIQIPDGNVYKIYYLSDGNFTGRTGTTYYPERDGKWFTGVETSPSTDVIPAGATFWYRSNNYATPFDVSVAGAVVSDVSRTVAIDLTYTLISNPYPVNMVLNEAIGYQDGMVKGNSTTGDQIQVPDGDVYKIYYLSDGNFSGRTGTQYYADRDGKWFTGVETTPSTGFIPVGVGAWYKRNGEAFTLTVNSPIK